jgi:hypothetical protein
MAVTVYHHHALIRDLFFVIAKQALFMLRECCHLVVLCCSCTAYRKTVILQVTDTVPSYDLNLPHAVTVSCDRYTIRFPVCYGSQKHHECKGEMSGRWWRVMLHVQICSGRNRIIPLMRRPNTDSAANMPVTLPRNQLLIRYVVTSSDHTVTIRCYGTR